jgi:hypothetical protein
VDAHAHEAAPVAWAAWLEASGLGEVARNSLWLYPVVSIAHVLGLAVLVGGILAFDLRVLGAARGIPLAEAGRLILPLARAGFVVAAASGVVMLAADATHIAGNPAFLVKAVLLLLAGANVLLFHVIAQADLASPIGGLARTSAACSAVLWLSIAASGRAIAYF